MEQVEECKHTRLEIDDQHVAWLHFDNADSSTNVLSPLVLHELSTHVANLEQASPRALVLLSDKNNGFIAGADIREFTKITTEQEAFEYIRSCQKLFDRVEALKFPTICVIHGFCLGGGLELAMACQYRIAQDELSTRLGLPEVRLGIHPGFGGSVRLPLLVGGAAALDMMLSGRTVSARAAAKMGLVHYAVPQRQLLSAARQVARNPPTRRKLSWTKRITNVGIVRPLIAEIVKKKVSAKAPAIHYPAPYALIDLWRTYIDRPSQMMVQEAHSVARLLLTDTSRNLIRVFYLQEKMKGLGRSSEFQAQHVHVVGAGVMGGDIAAWCALRGLNVSLQDQSAERIAPAIQRAYKLFKQKLKQKRLVDAAMDRLRPDTSGNGISRADVVIEAIFEDLNAKQELFKNIEPKLKSTALLATNTSSIPLEEISEVLQNPQRLVGLHFFNPVAKMQLVEIVKTNDTPESIISDAAKFTRQIDRLPLVVTSTPGFLVNRILMPYLLEAVTLVEEGISPSQVDKAALHFGMPMGPIELSDTVGLDICLSVAEILSKRLGGEVPRMLRDRVVSGNLGRKSGRGFYEYKKGKAIKPKADVESQTLKEIEARLILRMLNEVVQCYRENVVESEDLLDAGIIFGTGFAPFRGGPIHYMKNAGIGEQKTQLAKLEEHYGKRFRADTGWDAFA